MNTVECGPGDLMEVHIGGEQEGLFVEAIRNHRSLSLGAELS